MNKKNIYFGIILLLALSLFNSIYREDYITALLSALGIGLVLYQIRVNEDVKLVIMKHKIHRKFRKNNPNDYFVILLQITNLSTYSQFYDIHLSDYIMEQTYKILRKKIHKNVFIYSADQILIIQEFDNKTVINQLLRTNEQIEKTKRILSFVNHLKFNPTNSVEYYQARVVAGTGSNGIRNDMTSIESMIKLANFSLVKAMKEQRQFLIATEETRIIKEDIDSFNKEIEQGIEYDEFKPHFLPIINPDTLQVIGCESLLRWEKSEYRIIEASKFRDIAIEKHLFDKIDMMILEHSLQSYQQWRKKQLVSEDFTITINLSKQSLISVKPYEFIRLTEQYETNRNCIEFDISEQDILDYEVSQAIKKLKAVGFKVSLDAFSSNTSSLQTLSNIGVDTLKLDRMNLPVDDKITHDYHLYKTLINLSKLMGYRVMSKGIENQAQLRMAKELHVDFVQGYYFPPPLNDTNILGFLNKYRSGIPV